MNSINWLHLTDLHIGEKPAEEDNLYPAIKGSFLEDLKRLHEVCGPWDLLLLTGDLVYSGKEDEFKQADQLLDELMSELAKMDSTPILLAVPGNHDLVRPAQWIAEPLTKWDAAIQADFSKDDSDSRNVVDKAFKNYQKWWEKRAPKENLKPGKLPGEFTFRFKNRDGIQLGVVGLNTAFLHLNDAKEGALAIAPVDVVQWAKENHASILLSHHPTEWLSEESQNYFLQGLFNPKLFAAHFYGHMHEPRYWSTKDAGGTARRGFQGKSLFSKTPISGSKVERLHGYSAGRLELSKTDAELKIWPRHAMAPGNTWIFVPDFQNYQIDEKNLGAHCVSSETVQLVRPYDNADALAPAKEDISSPLPLTLKVKKNAVALVCDGQTVATCRIDYDDPVKQVVQPFIEQLSHGDIESKKLELLGKFLFKALFNGQVRERFEEYRSTAGRRLRLQLQFEDDHELATLPWEYMFYYSRIKKYYLSTEVDLNLSRFMPPPRNLNPANEKLRMLLVFSQPAGNDFGKATSPEVVFKSVAALKNIAWDQPGSVLCESFDGRIEITVCTQPTYPVLSGHMKNHFDIVHFIGHGKLADDGEHEIALRDDKNAVDWNTEASFIQLFERKDAVPQLVFLQLSEKGKEPEKRVASLAQKLITSGVYFVVAMQHWISNEAAGTFAEEFYTHLAKEQPVDVAVQNGRRHVTINAYKREFGMPVVYLCSDSALLKQKRDVMPEPQEQEPLRPSEKALSAGAGAVPRR